MGSEKVSRQNTEDTGQPVWNVRGPVYLAQQRREGHGHLRIRRTKYASLASQHSGTTVSNGSILESKDSLMKQSFAFFARRVVLTWVGVKEPAIHENDLIFENSAEP